MNSIFPTSYSTLSSSALGTLIADNYGLKNVACEFLIRGVGDTYNITTQKEKFILRVYRSANRSLSHIKAEVELLNVLKNSGVSVSYPVADRAGNFIQFIEAAEGTRHAVLFSFAPGGPIQNLNDNHARLLGTEMGKFHIVSTAIKLKDTRWNFDFETTLTGPLQTLEPFFKDDPESLEWLQQAVVRAQKQLSEINTIGFRSGYCHFDFLPKNFHFNKGDSITFFDFDFFGYGWVVNDIMTFWIHLCLEVHMGKLTQEAANKLYGIFLDGYRQQRSVSTEELAAVPYLSLGFWLFYFNFYTTHDQFYPLLHHPHLKARINLIRKLTERYWGD